MCPLKNYIKSFLGTLQLSSRLSISCWYLNFSLEDIGWAYDCRNDVYVLHVMIFGVIIWWIVIYILFPKKKRVFKSILTPVHKNIFEIPNHWTMQLGLLMGGLGLDLLIMWIPTILLSLILHHRYTGLRVGSCLSANLH